MLFQSKSTNTLVLLILAALAIVAFGCGRSLTLTPADNEANSHMANSLNYKNQFFAWMNEIPADPDEGPSEEEWLESLELLNRSITEAKLVPAEFLGRAHGELPESWQALLIPSMEKVHEYYFNAISNPQSVELPNTERGMQQLRLLTDGRNLNDLWGDWYSQNRNAIRSGVRDMAE